MPLSATQLAKLKADQAKVQTAITNRKNAALVAVVTADINALVPDSVTPPPPPPPSPLVFNPPSQESLTVGTPFTLTLSASGGTAPYTFTSSGLPAGLSLSGGVISGTPTGSSSVAAVTCKDSSNPVQTKPLSIVFTVATVTPPPPPPPPGTVTRGNLFMVGDTVTVKAPSSATSFKTIDVFDDVTTGAISGGVFQETGYRAGWYRLEWFNGTTSVGSTQFTVSIPAPHLPANPAAGSSGIANDALGLGIDTVTRTIMDMGMERWSMDPRQLTASGNNVMSLPELLQDIAQDATYWATVNDPAHPRSILVAGPNGPYDCVRLNTSGGFWTACAADLSVNPLTTWVQVTNSGPTSFTVEVLTGASGSLTQVETWPVTQTPNTNMYCTQSKYIRLFGYPNNWVTLTNQGPNMLAEKAGVNLLTNLTSAAKQIAAVVPGGVFRFEGPWNEPGETGSPLPDFSIGNAQFLVWEAHLQRQAVLAGAPNAIYVGPGNVGNTNPPPGKSSELAQPLAAAKAMGVNPFDEYSTHTYNGGNGDPWLMDESWANFVGPITQYGNPQARRWQTEQGDMQSVYGVLHPYRQIRWGLTRLINQEAMGGIQPQDSYYWRDGPGGDWDNPMFYRIPDGSTTSVAAGKRVWGIMSYGKNFESSFPLGNASQYARVYRWGETVLNVGDLIVLYNAGGPALAATLQIGEAGVIYDAFGNYLGAAEAGTVQISVTGLPIYLSIPKGTTVSVTDIDGLMTATPITGGTDSTSGNANGIGQIQAGPANSYLWNNGLGFAPGPWFDSSGAVPCSVTRTFSSAQQIGGIAWQCGGPPWQSLAAPGAFEIDALVNGTWTPVYQYSNPSMVSTPFNDGPANGGNGTGTVAETYWDEAWSFHCPFKSKVSATAIRITATSLSHGGEPDAAAATLGQPGKPMFSVRGILVHG